MRDQVLRTGQGEAGFRWRGREVSRIENLSDIVFALALSLIALASVPRTFYELTDMWRDGVAIAGCFMIFMVIWRMHYVFFRRYDLEDGRTVFLNTILLFLVMVFAYPLKFLTRFMVDLVMFFAVRDPSGEEIMQILRYEDARWLTVIYGAGYIAVFAVFAALYKHAASLADALDLTPVERIRTRESIHMAYVQMGAAALAIILAVSLPAFWAAWSGWAFMLIWPVSVWVGTRTERRIAALEEAGS